MPFVREGSEELANVFGFVLAKNEKKLLFKDIVTVNVSWQNIPRVKLYCSYKNVSLIKKIFIFNFPYLVKVI